jgi:conjugal transfer pilin signal peptidase TrbI
MNGPLATGARRTNLLSWWAAGASLLAVDMRRRWYLFVLVAAVWMLAILRLFVYHTPILPLQFNWSASIPYRVVYVDYRSTTLTRGDLIVYAFEGEAARKEYPGLKDQPFFKRIAGVAGDKVTVANREVFVNGVSVGLAKTHTFDRRPLEPIEATVIPPGLLYVQGTSPDSFDSRYRASGLVAVRDVTAKVHPLF